MASVDVDNLGKFITARLRDINGTGVFDVYKLNMIKNFQALGEAIRKYELPEIAEIEDSDVHSGSGAGAGAGASEHGDGGGP